MVFFEAQKLVKYFGDKRAIGSISLKVNYLEKLAIAGETGSGKSTFLKIIAGLIQPDEGSVYFKGNKVDGPDEKLVAGNQDIAYLSQHFELAKFLRVEQILSYSNKLSKTAAEKIFTICRINHLLKRKSDQLSGGEKQRVALARLLIAHPSILLLDEPFSNLDYQHKKTIKEVLEEICSKLKITIILISHDPVDCLSWADRIVVLKKGKIVQDDDPVIIYTKPKSQYVAGLFGLFSEFTYNNSKLILRPEQVKITGEKDIYQGEIIAVKFHGGFYILEVMVDSHVVLVRTDEAFRPGDFVFLSIPELL